MIRKVMAMVVASVALTVPAVAQPTPAPEGGDDNRYMYNRVQDGFVRLDTRTGQVSLCSKRSVGWACHAMPEERTALDAEIARLQSENALLKKELLSRGLDLPGGVKADSPPAARSEPDIRLPSDADVERVLSFIERAWRRLVEVIVSIQKDVMKGG